MSAQINVFTPLGTVLSSVGKHAVRAWIVQHLRRRFNLWLKINSFISLRTAGISHLASVKSFGTLQRARRCPKNVSSIDGSQRWRWNPIAPRHIRRSFMRARLIRSTSTGYQAEGGVVNLLSQRSYRWWFFEVVLRCSGRRSTRIIYRKICLLQTPWVIGLRDCTILRCWSSQ